MTPLPPPDPNLPYALYRLAKLAIDMHVSRHGHAARDTAMMHAYVILGHYLLCAHPTGRGGGAGGGAEAGVPPELPGLVGAMVWEARAMGLDVDPDEFDPIETRGGGGGGRQNDEEQGRAQEQEQKQRQRQRQEHGQGQGQGQGRGRESDDSAASGVRWLRRWKP